MAPKNRRKPNISGKQKGKLSRKQLRKDKRKEKKIRRNDYHSQKRSFSASKKMLANTEKLGYITLSSLTGDSCSATSSATSSATKPLKKALSTMQSTHMKAMVKANSLVKSSWGNKVLSIEEIHNKEKREQKKVQKDMIKQRKKQLLRENEKEDATIRKLEKQLKLHKRKSKSVPQSFVTDGLDYLLEVCDVEYMKNSATAEQDLNDINDNFEEDYILMTGKEKLNKTKQKANNQDSSEEEYSDDEDLEDLLSEDDCVDDFHSNSGDENVSFKVKEGIDHLDINSENDTEIKRKKSQSSSSEEDFELCDINELSASKQHSSKNAKAKRKLCLKEKDIPLSKKKKIESLSEPEDDNAFSTSNIEGKAEAQDGGDADCDNDNREDFWEDIYGRLRSKDGAVLNEKKERKYVPPAIRARLEANGGDDAKHKMKLDKLKKRLKGLLNRLAESNMHNIANQIEELYMTNSRNDMNETLTALITESLISTVMTPERLLMEHVLLIAVLHANVGNEVGAHFLQVIAKCFDNLTKSFQNVENKTLDNVVTVLAQLYNFKVFDAKLLYEILLHLGSNFEEKNVDCILHVLRSVGFSLRKDDPIALKNLILELQKQAASVSEGNVSDSRVKFLLNILLAIKNNNVTKIPNYDISYSEHLKKIMKGFIRKGNYVTPLNISLEDLRNADERGKWWVVGSAWTGKIETSSKKEVTGKSNRFSQQLLDLARKQRMNTDTRRDIFCILMSAEDYLDAFEKLLRLGLKTQQEREIIHIIVHCCLHEKSFNPFYAVLAQKFCEYDRRFQMTIKCSVWDKLKTLNSHSGLQISSLAKLLTHLFIHKGLPISTLKIVQFSELDKVTLRLVRQILLGILLHEELEAVQAVFTNIALADKLKMFRESLRLFIHHFLLRNLKDGVVNEDQKRSLEIRAKMVDKILTAKEFRGNW
ncbi:nucleolar MIF4G domain-containing protein 1 homolog isoform X2 [Euwallacea fornicatus]|uniref:nucleolar MIF4G domain-containing protein 1 homolog isoform X2 n=1 Tax=Euwallacea fornicatus TaxID=995702 RepID=UPI003390188A